MNPLLQLQLRWGGLLVALVAPTGLAGQTLSISPQALADSNSRPGTIRRLAAQAAAMYRERNPLTQIDNLFRLQLLAGRPAEAQKMLARLRPAQKARGDTSAQGRAVDAQYEIYFRARELQS